jgi:hypothetical protein
MAQQFRMTDENEDYRQIEREGRKIENGSSIFKIEIVQNEM